MMTNKIEIGKEGWQAIIADDFTIENLSRVALATAEWMKIQGFKKIVLGFDCRFGGKMFSRKVAKVMAYHECEILTSETFVTTAMIANGVMMEKADLGIYITGGAQPYFFSGFKLISSQGDVVHHNIESFLKEKFDLKTKSIKHYKAIGKIKVINLEDMYYQRILTHFDINAIRQAEIRVVFDAMHGAAQKIWQLILPESLRIRCDLNSTFDEKIPDPTAENLVLMSQLVNSTPYTSCGIGLGGAAEKINICNEKGEFVDVDHIKSILDLREMEDGVWIALSLLQHLAQTGKKVSEL